MNYNLILRGPFYKEEFDLSGFSFKRPLDKGVLDFIQDQNFFEKDVAKNLHYFFLNTQVFIFNKNKKRCAKNNICFEKIKHHICWSEMSPWSCHIAAPYFSIENKDWNCIFGFASQNINESSSVNTFLHTFNFKGLNFIDTTIESRCLQEKEWAKRHVIENPRLKTEDFFDYFGVEIPKNVIQDILYIEKDKGITGNLWGYLKNKIFCSKEKTDQFIEVINNNGKNWKYEK